MKENFYLTIYNKIKEGKNPAKISKELSISKQKVSYYICKLKENDVIKKVGYGTWEIKQELTSKNFTDGDTHLRRRIIRGHAFIWKIKIPDNIKKLIKERIKEFNSTLGNGFTRLIINERKVWIGKKNIIVYEQKSFYGVNSLESRKYAVISLLETLSQLETKLRLKITPIIFSPAREHYGMIKNDLAIQCNRRKEKISVRDDLEGNWLWIDDSESLGELEVSGTKAIVRSKQVQDWWNDNKKHNFQVTPSFVLEQINNVTSNQLMFNNNFESHIKAIKQLGNSTEANSKTIELLADIVKELVEEVRLLRK